MLITHHLEFSIKNNFLMNEKGGRGLPFVTNPPRCDLIGTPPARECWN